MNNDDVMRSFNASEDSGDGKSPALFTNTAAPVARDAGAAATLDAPVDQHAPAGAVFDERIYFIGDQELARGSGEDLPPWGIGIYCHYCGNVWARVISTLRRPESTQQWIFQESLCVAHLPTHGTRWYIPGSIIPALRPYAAGLGRDYQWASHLPTAVLEREARVHLDWWARRA